MQIWNNGMIVFNKALSEGAMEKLDALFGFDETCVLSQDGKPELDFYDYPGNLDEGDFNDVVKIAEADGAKVTDGDICYYGDYDGGYYFDHEANKFCHAGEDGYVIHNADTESLLNELRKRGVLPRDPSITIDGIASKFRAYVENDLAAAEPDYVREVLFDQIGTTKAEADYLGLGYLWPKSDTDGKARVFDIQWDIDIEDAYERLDDMTAKDAAEAIECPEEAYANMTTEERHDYAYDLWHHCPAALEEFMGLPNEVEIPDELAGCDDEDISNWLSDAYGFCHKGFRLSTDGGEEGA